METNTGGSTTPEQKTANTGADPNQQKQEQQQTASVSLDEVRSLISQAFRDHNAGNARKAQQQEQQATETERKRKQTLEEQVTAMRAEMDAKEAALAKRTQKLGIQEALSAHSLDAELSEVMSAYIEQKYNGQIVVEGDKVLVDLGGLKGRQGIQTVVAEIMKSPIGARLAPPVQTPKVSAKGSPAGASFGDAASWSALPYKQIMERATKDPAGFKAYCKENPEDFRDKMKAQ